MFCLFLSIFYCFKWFSKKLLCLLMLEMSFLSVIWATICTNICYVSFAPVFLVLCIYLVCDSVYAITCLTCYCRNSSIYQSQLLALSNDYFFYLLSFIFHLL